MSSKKYPKFSIIAPVYNSRSYLSACIYSVLEQTYQNFEFLLIDDGSTDGSAELIQRLIQGRDNCRFIQNKHGGVCKARNAGLDSATGDYICFIDSDDLIYPDYLSSIVEAADKFDPDVFYFYTKYGINKRPRQEYDGEPYLLFDKKDIRFLASASICHTPEIDSPSGRFSGISSFSAWGQVYRADLFRDNRIRFTPGLIVSEDGLFNLETLYYADTAVVIRRELYNYRTDNVSATRSFKPALLDSFQIRNTYVKQLIHTLYEDDPVFWEHYYCGLIYQLRAVCQESIFHTASRLSQKEKNQCFYEMIDLPDYAAAVSKCEDCYLPGENRVYLQFAKDRDPSSAQKHSVKSEKAKRTRNLIKRILKKVHLR